jgi:tetrahydromethanopterin S-methyltransferase subunit A
MYEGPINMICGELQMHLEGETLKAVQNFGVDVNKEELIKALQYDREQYRKGYKDGYADAIDECIRIIEETVWKDTDMLVESIRELKGGAV